MSELYKLLDKINKELGVTIIIVSHFKEEIIDHANKIVQLEQSKVFCGTPEEYKDMYIINKTTSNIERGENNE